MSAAAAVPQEPMVIGSTAPGVIYSVAPVQYAAAPVQYVTAPQSVQYVTAQPTVQYQPQQYVVVDGQTMVMGEQARSGSAAVPLQYEYAQPGQVMYTTAAPAVYSISPERFAQIAAGIPLTQAEIDAMTSGTALPAQGAPYEPAMPSPLEPALALASAGAAAITSAGAAVAGSAAAAVGSAKATKKDSKKKSLKKSSKKKKAGCC